MATKAYKIIILGGGIAGLADALALTKFASPETLPTIEVYEVRPEPGTIGGALSLTPNALRVLEHLGVCSIIESRNFGISVGAIEVFNIYQPTKLTELSFGGPKNTGVGKPPYKGIRLTRASLMVALVEAVQRVANITLHCGKKATYIKEDDLGVIVSFEDGTTASGDVLLGCDGVHSFTRNTHVDPSRKQIYSGVSNAFGYAPIKDGELLHFNATALNFARRGVLLTSYYEPTKTSGYVGAIVTVSDVGSRDDWKAKGSDAAAVRADMLSRFGDSVLPTAKVFIQDAEDWYMWPVYMLPPGGRWATARTMLLGDAAHAMPPQGEATGIPLENAVLLARCLLRKQEVGGGIKEAFDDFERLRRKRIDDAYKESQEVVSSVRDAGYIGHALKMGIIPIFLWMGRSRRLKHFEEDVTLTPLGFEDVAMSSSSSMLLLRSWTDGFTASELFKSLWYRLWSAWSVKKLKP